MSNPDQAQEQKSGEGEEEVEEEMYSSIFFSGYPFETTQNQEQEQSRDEKEEPDDLMMNYLIDQLKLESESPTKQ